MKEQKQTQTKTEEKKVVSPVKTEVESVPVNTQTATTSTSAPSIDNKFSDVKQPEKKEEKKVVAPKVVKTEATAKGEAIHASKKHCMYIGTFIKGKTVDAAIADLEQVIKLKRAIPFKGEIPHRKGKGMMSGRYPVSASKLFITMLKGLRGNILVNNMNADKTRIFSVVSNWASRPRRSSGKGKRTNVVIVAKPIVETKKEDRKQSNATETKK